jgi:hypothetical protein
MGDVVHVKRAPRETISGSGGRMVLLGELTGADDVDISGLESLRPIAGLPRAGAAPFFAPGDVITWHYKRVVTAMRVIRDDPRGLVAWVPSGSQVLSLALADGRGGRDIPLAERFTAPRRPVISTWRGHGSLRVAPAGKPWSIWYFWTSDGQFRGQYVNLELPHVRLDASTRSVDLILDLWVDDEGTWLKDADELVAAGEQGLMTPEQASTVGRLADVARRDLIEVRAWPLDEDWPSWRPAPEHDIPLLLPDEAAALESIHIAPASFVE